MGAAVNGSMKPIPAFASYKDVTSAKNDFDFDCAATVAVCGF